MGGGIRKRYIPSSLDIAAVLFAIILSLGCMVKGLVDDMSVAVAMVLILPVLALAMRFKHGVHSGLLKVGLSVISGALLVLLIQWGCGGGAGHIGSENIEYQNLVGVVSSDTYAWMQGAGHVVYLSMVFGLALLVGASESSARLFVHWLLISGIVAMTITFFIATDNGVPSTTHFSFRHGFVNPNNAAAYLGIMMLVSTAQALRFFRLPSGSLQKSVMSMIDQLSIEGIMKGGALLYCLLLSLASLFMTGSRAGILLALLSAMVLCGLAVRKMQIATHWRYAIISGVAVLASAICIWSFINFGQVITNKFETNGVSANSRPDIFVATLPMIADYPLIGVGIGNYAAIFQQYRPTSISSDGIIDKAHNSYLELAAEMGIPMLVLVLVAAFWVGRQLYHGVKEREERYVTPALGLSVWLFGVLFSLIDFPLQIPGILAVFVALMAVCVSQADRRYNQPSESMSQVPTRRVRIRKRRSRTKMIV